MNKKTQYLLLGALTASAWWGLSMLTPHMNKENALALYWLVPLVSSLITIFAVIEDSN
jgi:hypothetical protein